MNEELTKAMLSVGLTRNESLVYSALIDLGESKVSEIIKKLNFRSGKIYEVLNSLLRKGLIAQTIKNNIKLFSAMPPSRIEEYLDEKKEEIEIQKNKIHDFIRSLKDSSKSKNHCLIRVFEGIEGIISATYHLFEDTKPKEEVYSYGVSVERKEAIYNMWARVGEIAREKDIRNLLVIAHKSKESKNAVKKIWKKVNLKIRFREGEHKVNFSGNDRMVLIYNFEEENCILIENIFYASAFKSIFMNLFNSASQSPR